MEQQETVVTLTLEEVQRQWDEFLAYCEEHLICTTK